MATVVITFFLFARFSVCKMDADCIVRQRDQLLSRREKRWSMNSQRLEEIVAELMKPISDVRRSFDTDLSALLEEYLTEAGLHALDAGEDASVADAVAPNFAELALLLQQSASIYGRKVDFLYQHVLSVSDSLHNSTQDVTSTSEEPATPSASRRRRKASTSAGDFAHIALEAAAAARREAAPARPPPTLPRTYIQLAPRVLSPADAPLHDYAGEPIGLLSDFQVTWRLHKGLLVDELEGASSSEDRALRPISLLELQAAIEAAAPPPLPPCHEESPPRDVASPLHASTPLPACDVGDAHDVSDKPAPAHDVSDAAAPVGSRKERKRRSDVEIDDIIGTSVKTVIGKVTSSSDLRRKLSEVREFSIATEWITKVVGKRKSHILSERRKLRAQEPNPPPEFAGWSCVEAASATAAAKESRLGDPDSEDDGFFEQSSVGDSDASRAEEAPAGRDWAEWRAAVLRRAARAEARAVDVRALGGAVLAALPPAQAQPFAQLLRRTAREPSDVSHLLLATLFLANAGNVELLAGPALSLGSFSVRLLSSDPRLYCAAADQQFLR